MTRTTRLTLDADGQLRHHIPPGELSNDLAGWIADDLVAPGLIPPHAFEDTFVSVVDGAWLPFYRNTLRELARGGAPGHQRGHGPRARPRRRPRPRLRGGAGCCFGFLSLRLARDGHRVTAVDLSPGTVELLALIAPALGPPLHALAGDATAIPLADRSADTVFAVHLLEHLPPALAPRVIAEMSRVARRRVVVAVPFEHAPNPTWGTSARSTWPISPRSASPPAARTPWTNTTAAGSSWTSDRESPRRGRMTRAVDVRATSVGGHYSRGGARAPPVRGKGTSPAGTTCSTPADSVRPAHADTRHIGPETAMPHLPENPSLEHLRRQARTLLRQFRAADAEALALLREHHPRPHEPLRLADAQLVVARSYGFASWPALRRHMDVVGRFARSPHTVPPSADAPTSCCAWAACATAATAGPTRPAPSRCWPSARSCRREPVHRRRHRRRRRRAGVPRPRPGRGQPPRRPVRLGAVALPRLLADRR
jgi:hypothetical protein